MNWFFVIWGWLAALPGEIAGAVLAALHAVGAFTADFFWALATSPLVLIALAALAVVAFAVAHLPWVGTLFPSTVPFMRTAGIVSVAAFAALFFFLGARIADARSELAKAENDLAWAEYQLDQQRKVADAADELRKQALDEKANAEEQLAHYKEKFGDHPLDPPPGTLDWMRSLQRRPQSGDAGHQGGAIKPKRSALARVRAPGGQRQ